ncbi:MAG: carbonic anhydrase family protein [Caldilineae bacterium]|nr:MAG: carbonic anhydrase family protein [Caldilineae bacterium]
MKQIPKFRVFLLLSLLAGLLVFVGAVAASGPVHWGYEGENGPEHWGELSPDFATCSTGTEQSPVDIPASAPINAANIVFNYQPTALNIVNNGHTIQVNYDEGSSMQVEGKTYNLLQFHFHAPSEHTLDGQYSDMEMHLVHQSADGEYAVVGVMLKRGAENPAYAPVMNNLPPTEGEPETISGVSVNAADLLPADQSYYRYNGSFTTPPCTEGVKWFVLTAPVELSDAQVSAFEQIYSGNYRPVQPLNNRTFLQGELPSPELLPVSGGTTFPMVEVLAGLGILLAGAGLFIRRRSVA